MSNCFTFNVLHTYIYIYIYVYIYMLRGIYSEVKQVFGQRLKPIYDCFWEEKQCLRVTIYS